MSVVSHMKLFVDIAFRDKRSSTINETGWSCNSANVYPLPFGPIGVIHERINSRISVSLLSSSRRRRCRVYVAVDLKRPKCYDVFAGPSVIPIKIIHKRITKTNVEIKYIC